MIVPLPQVVTIDRTLDVTIRHGLSVQRLLHGHSRKVRCRFAQDLGNGKARGPITCTLRVYRTWNQHGLLAAIPMSVTLVRYHAPISYEDGSGWRTYKKTGPRRAWRSLAFDPR